jgi:hypothetical protein
MQITSQKFDLLVQYLQEGNNIGQINLVRLEQAMASQQPLQQSGLEKIAEYDRKLNDQKNVPLEIVKLVHSLKENGVTPVTLYEFFGIKSRSTDDIPVPTFEKALEEIAYVPTNKPELIAALDKAG